MSDHARVFEAFDLDRIFEPLVRLAARLSTRGSRTVVADGGRGESRAANRAARYSPATWVTNSPRTWVFPKVAERTGYVFKKPDLGEALDAVSTRAPEVNAA